MDRAKQGLLLFMSEFLLTYVACFLKRSRAGIVLVGGRWDPARGGWGRSDLGATLIEGLEEP